MAETEIFLIINRYQAPSFQSHTGILAILEMRNHSRED